MTSTTLRPARRLFTLAVVGFALFASDGHAQRRAPPRACGTYVLQRLYEDVISRHFRTPPVEIAMRRDQLGAGRTRCRVGGFVGTARIVVDAGCMRYVGLPHSIEGPYRGLDVASLPSGAMFSVGAGVTSGDMLCGEHQQYVYRKIENGFEFVERGQYLVE